MFKRGHVTTTEAGTRGNGPNMSFRVYGSGFRVYGFTRFRL
jgi:hypothetical protein